MAKCVVCGKLQMSGHNVPHSLHKTKRKWNPNVQKVTLTRDGHPQKVYVCTQCLRTMNKTKGK